QADLRGVGAGAEHHGDGRGGLLGGDADQIAADGGDDVGLGGDQLGQQGGHAVVVSVAPADVDRDVLAVDVAAGLEALLEGHQQVRVGRQRAAAHVGDAR